MFRKDANAGTSVPHSGPSFLASFTRGETGNFFISPASKGTSRCAQRWLFSAVAVSQTFVMVRVKDERHAVVHVGNQFVGIGREDGAGRDSLPVR